MFHLDVYHLRVAEYQRVSSPIRRDLRQALRPPHVVIGFMVADSGAASGDTAGAS